MKQLIYLFFGGLMIVLQAQSCPYTVDYHFYGQNLPTAGFYAIEFVNPQTNELFSLCGFSGSSNAAANPPVIITQPQTQSVGEGNMLTPSVRVFII